MARNSANFFNVCWRSVELQRVRVSFGQLIEREILLENVNAADVLEDNLWVLKGEYSCTRISGNGHDGKDRRICWKLLKGTTCSNLKYRVLNNSVKISLKCLDY